MSASKRPWVLLGQFLQPLSFNHFHPRLLYFVTGTQGLGFHSAKPFVLFGCLPSSFRVYVESWTGGQFLVFCGLFCPFHGRCFVLDGGSVFVQKHRHGLHASIIFPDLFEPLQSMFTFILLDRHLPLQRWVRLQLLLHNFNFVLGHSECSLPRE